MKDKIYYIDKDFNCLGFNDDELEFNTKKEAEHFIRELNKHSLTRMRIEIKVRDRFNK